MNILCSSIFFNQELIFQLTAYVTCWQLCNWRWDAEGTEKSSLNEHECFMSLQDISGSVSHLLYRLYFAS